MDIKNDFELLYLIRIKKSELARNFFLEKYYPLIYKLINVYKIPNYLREDTFQECLEVLFNAIYTFDDMRGVIFYTYIKLLLERRIVRLIYHNEEYRRDVVLSDFDIMSSEDVYSRYVNETRIRKIVNNLDYEESLIFDEIIINNSSVKELALTMKISQKAVYNKIYRLRKKIKNNM